MDLARCVILVTGVVFHAAHIFANTGWMIASEWHSAYLSGFVGFVRGFRMEALFLVSGFFSAVLVTRRGSKGFVANRMVRMGVPLLVCGLVANPFISLFADDRFRQWTWAEHILSGGWMYHAWNVGALLVFEALMFASLWFLPGIHGWLSKTRLPALAVLVAYMAILTGIGFLSSRWGGLLPGMVVFDTGVFVYWPAYLLGYAIHQNVKLRDTLFDWRFAWGMVLLSVAAQLVLARFFPQVGAQRGERLIHLLWAFALFSTVKVFQTRSLWVRRLSIASYTIYLLHLPLQFALYRAFPALHSGYWAWVVLWLVPIALLWTFHVQVVERWKWAGFLFNGKIYDEKTRSF